jgi:cytidyltransferase-like protein
MRHNGLVWLNGSFDVLHMGHIKLFQRARQMGLPVVVGVDTDGRISELKGHSSSGEYS